MIDFDFPSLRSLLCKFLVSNSDDVDKLRKVINHLLKCPKLRDCQIFLHLPEDYDTSRFNCLIEHEIHKLELEIDDDIVLLKLC